MYRLEDINENVTSYGNRTQQTCANRANIG